MIISHKHKFIFIKTKKTAGTSLEIALSGICGDDDIITPIVSEDEKARVELGVKGAQNYYIPFSKFTPYDYIKPVLKFKRPKYYNHISALEVKKYIGKEIWNSYYKFCFERNPFDKAVSLYYWRIKNKTNPLPFSKFIRSGNLNNIKGYQMYSINGLVAVDDVFKFEDITGALEKLSNRIGLSTPLEMPTYRAKSQYRVDKRPYKELINAEDRRLIEIIFGREIRLLDYQF